MFDNELDPEVQRVRDQIIKKIGPILAINNKEVPNHHVVKKTY